MDKKLNVTFISLNYCVLLLLYTFYLYDLTKIRIIMKKLLLSTLTLLFSIFSFGYASENAKVYVIATGGTIAGRGSTSVTTAYAPSVLTVDDIIASVDGVESLAQIEAVQFSNISSQNMTSEDLLRLSVLVDSLQHRDDVKGVVITHGTDTMEESAYMLSLLCSPAKPTVFVAAMRPSTALGADGPANLYSAISTAASDESKGRGVMVVMNDYIFAARDVVKGNTQNTAAFYAPNGSAEGVVTGGKPFYTQLPLPCSPFEYDVMPTSLPKVAILYGHIDAEPKMVDMLVELGYKGLVYAGVGHGNMNDATLETLASAREKGVAVVRASRVVSGLVTCEGEVDDKALGFTSSGLLNPAKARVLLALALDAASGDVALALEIFDSKK